MEGVIIFQYYICSMVKKRKRLTMDELVVNAKKFLKQKKQESKNRDAFEIALKKAVTITY